MSDSNSFLELHHIEPLKYRKKGTKTTSEDVELVCPNCHKAIHRIMIEEKLTVLSMEEFKKRILRHSKIVLNKTYNFKKIVERKLI